MTVTDPMALLVARLLPAQAAGQDARQGYAENLRIGQILRGKVLRVEDGGGYVMDFGNGRHLLVESTSQLNPGEVLRGRVVETGERIVIQRLATQSEEPEQPDAARFLADLEAAGVAISQEQRTFVTQHFALFAPAVWSELAATSYRGDESAEMLKARAFLKKLGIDEPSSLAGSLLDYFRRPQVSPALSYDRVVMTDVLPESAQPSTVGARTDEQLARELATRSETFGETLAELLREPSQQGAGDAQQDGAGASGRELFGVVMRWLLNAQGSDEAVCHRYLVVPFAVNGKLVEVEMTLFDQPRDGQLREGHKERTALISLRTEMLGAVGTKVREVDRHLSIDFSSDSEAGLAGLMAGRGQLERSLGEMGYQLDRIEYALADAGVTHSAVRTSVSEWVLNTDSLSVLM